MLDSLPKEELKDWLPTNAIKQRKQSNAGEQSRNEMGGDYHTEDPLAYMNDEALKYANQKKLMQNLGQKLSY